MRAAQLYCNVGDAGVSKGCIEPLFAPHKEDLGQVLKLRHWSDTRRGNGASQTLWPWNRDGRGSLLRRIFTWQTQFLKNTLWDLLQDWPHVMYYTNTLTSWPRMWTLTIAVHISCQNPLTKGLEAFSPVLPFNSIWKASFIRSSFMYK